MAKRGFTIDFGFIPVPEEAPDADPPLLQCEWQLLTYLLKQVRFGEELQPISDDELIKGIFEDGRRKDNGCRLSRNSLKKAREGLMERGWLETENVSNDVTRPRWIYRLVLAKRMRKPSGENATVEGVTDRQSVSKFDSGKKREQVSRSDTAVSGNDSAGVTDRQSLSKVDTCNKEDRKTKYLDKELEKAGDERPLSPNVLAIAQRNFWVMYEDLPVRPEFDADRDKMSRVRIAAIKSGLGATNAKAMLREHPDWKGWPYLEQIDSQAEIEFPSDPPAKSVAPEWVLPPGINPMGATIWEDALQSLSKKISPHTFSTWLKPTKGAGVRDGVLYVKIPTPEFSYIGEKFGQEIKAELPLMITDVRYISPEERSA